MTTILGADGDDHLPGSSGADHIDGRAGDDRLFSNGGTDTLIGGAGDDSLYGAQEADRMEGGEGHDALFANEGPDTLLGGAGADRLYGAGGDDLIFGDAAAAPAASRALSLTTAASRSMIFFIQGEPGLEVTVAEAAGALVFDLLVKDVLGPADPRDIADLRGLFFHVADESLLAAGRLTIDGALVTDHEAGANRVADLGNGVTMAGTPAQPFDVGVEFGTAGKAKDDVQGARFTIAHADQALTLEWVAQQTFGVRMTSVSSNGDLSDQGRSESLKLEGVSAAAPQTDAPSPPDGSGPPPDPPPAPPDAVGGDDLIEAGAGADTVDGGGGSDEIQGEGGDDVIIGGTDHGHRTGLADLTIGDNLYGNDGADIFRFQPGDGVDMIWDIQPGRDRIEVGGYAASDVTVAFVGALANRIPVDAHQKIAVLLGERDAIVFNDFPASNDGGPLLAFSDGSALSAADLKALAVRSADATLSVATLSYQFFTGKVPSAAGMEYLVSPKGPNPNNLNAPYYQDFNLENRYINFAVNLGREGEGRASFEAEYGGLSLSAATKKAYGEIFGAEPADAKVAALLSGGRDLYFEAYGRDGLDGLGTKAAMVGWLLAEAEKADLGLYARANAAFLADLLEGGADERGPDRGLRPGRVRLWKLGASRVPGACGSGLEPETGARPTLREPPEARRSAALSRATTRRPAPPGAVMRGPPSPPPRPRPPGASGVAICAALAPIARLSRVGRPPDAVRACESPAGVSGGRAVMTIQAGAQGAGGFCSCDHLRAPAAQALP